MPASITTLGRPPEKYIYTLELRDEFREKAVRGSYDYYDAFVVIAEDSKEARALVSEAAGQDDLVRLWGSVWYDTDSTSIRKIGTARVANANAPKSRVVMADRRL